MARDKTVGIWFHSFFEVPGWNPRDMGVAGWKAHLDWARSLGFNACIIFVSLQKRVDDPPWSYPERRRFYHGLLGPRPPFEPGNFFVEGDRLLDTPEARRNAEITHQVVAYAAQIGVRPIVCMRLNVGSPTFVLEHPELAGAFPDDFVHEGMSVCPNKPAGREHLLELWGGVIDYFDKAAGFILLGRDSGGCECQVCRSKPNPFLEPIHDFHKMIRAKRPDAEIYLAGWGFEDDEIAFMAGQLPRDIIAMEPPGIHYPGRRSAEDHVKRLQAWQEAGIEVHAHVEVTENPTFLLPPCYPKRVANIMRIEREAGVEDVWAGSTLHTFLFPFHYYVLSQLAEHPDKSAEQLTEEYLAGSLGPEAVEDGMKWVEAMGEVWTRLYAPVQRGAFALPLHTTFPASLFPVPLMNEPIPAELAEDIDATVRAAERAVEAVEQMAAKGTWRFGALETNILIISTKLVLARAQFRQAKLPVLDAIRRGKLTDAAAAFEKLTVLVRDMVETAAGAPNTQLLNSHWTKLALWPERLEAVKLHLPALVELKRIRGLFEDDPLSYWTPPSAQT